MVLLTKLRRRPSADLLAYARALALVAGVRVALSLLPYRTVEQALNPKRPARRLPSVEATWQYRQRVLWSVGVAARHLLRRKPCLTQALVARWLLARVGQQAEMRIGVHKEGKEIRAHAWLEQGGHVILGGSDSPFRYTPLTAMREVAA